MTLQGTFTAGNGPVGFGTKCGCPRAVAESTTSATRMIPSLRMPQNYCRIRARHMKRFTPSGGASWKTLTA